MADRLTPIQRHANMAAIRGKDTKPEMIVRRFLWGRGFRYRLNHRGLPGRPDIVLRRYRTCIFVNGCFWHGHHINESEDYLQLQSSACCKIPKTNRTFWGMKIMRNKVRDIEVQKKLASMGWHSVTIWECELTSRADRPGEMSIREKTLESLAYTLNRIYIEDHKVKRYEMPEEEMPLMAAEDTNNDYGKR